MKLGAINIVRLLDGSKRGQALAKQLKAVSDRWQAKGTALEQKLAEIQKAIEVGSKDGPSETVFKLERDGQLLTLELRQVQASAEFELNATRDHLRARLLDEAQVHIKKIAEERELTVVVTVPSRELAFVSPAIDVTQDVIDRLDKANPEPQVRARTEAVRRVP